MPNKSWKKAAEEKAKEYGLGAIELGTAVERHIIEMLAKKIAQDALQPHHKPLLKPVG
jgi:hypothetical protein